MEVLAHNKNIRPTDGQHHRKHHSVQKFASVCTAKPSYTYILGILAIFLQQNGKELMIDGATSSGFVRCMIDCLSYIWLRWFLHAMFITPPLLFYFLIEPTVHNNFFCIRLKSVCMNFSPRSDRRAKRAYRRIIQTNRHRFWSFAEAASGQQKKVPEEVGAWNMTGKTKCNSL